MKKFILISFVSLLMFSCKKEINPDSHDTLYVNNVIASLKDSLSDNDFANIIAEKVFITKINGTKYLRIPFKGKDISKDFVLLQTETSGKITRGFIINLSKNAAEKGKEYEFNGFITKSSLDRKLITISPLTNGVITHSHSGRVAQRDISFPVPKDTIIITTTGDVSTDGGGGITYSDWISVSGVFGYYGSYGGYGSYGSFGATGEYLYGGGGRYSGSSGYSPNNGGHYTEWEQPDVTESNPDGINSDALLVDYEFVENLSPIDVSKFLKCFSTVPDEGSTCSIEIFSDIPVDKDPNKLFNWQTASPGHTFLQIKKTNGNQSVMQNIGFYPMIGWKTLLTTAPVEGKFVDNSEHEFNASLKMSLTPEDLKKTLDEMSYLSGSIKYDIDEFNCTDFALNVFNASRISNPLEIPKYDIPGGTAVNGTNTPQGLFNELKSMQASGVEAENITIPGFKGFVADSNGPCN